MTQETLQPLIDWVRLHPHWAGFAVFIISLSESLVGVGLVVPGMVMMTAIGGLVGAGILPLWTTLLWAILGAIAGDGLSYWLGYHYKEHIRDLWPFKQFPHWLARGEAFFHHHGGKSIVLGRFIGPIRPIIPVIAGMLDMSPRRFLLFNIISAIAWAPLYSLPGAFIGASLDQLPPKIATRLGLLILLLLLVLWLIYSLTTTLLRAFGKQLRQCLNHFWSNWKNSRHCPRLYALLTRADDRNKGQLGTALLFVVSILGFGILLFNISTDTGLATWNSPLYRILRALYQQGLINACVLLSTLGAPGVVVPCATIMAASLAYHRRLRLGAYWLGPIILGLLAAYSLKHFIQYPRPEGLLAEYPGSSFPSTHVVMSTLFYGSLASFTQAILPKPYRALPWCVAIPLIICIALSRLYLGVHWLTDVLGGLFLGAAIGSLGIILLRNHLTLKTLPKTFFYGGALSLLLATLFYYKAFYPITRAGLIRQWPIHVMSTRSWWAGYNDAVQPFVVYRESTFECRKACTFQIQWLGNLEVIRQQLQAGGWVTPPRLTWRTMLNLFVPDPALDTLPVMPQYHRDRHPALIMVKAGFQPETRLLLQLWHSDLQTEQGTPIWVGTLQYEYLTHPLPFIAAYQKGDSNPPGLMKAFTQELRQQHITFRILHPQLPDLEELLQIKTASGGKSGE